MTDPIYETIPHPTSLPGAKILLRQLQGSLSNVKHATSLNGRFSCMLITVVVCLLAITFGGSLFTTIVGELFRTRLPPIVSVPDLMSFYDGMLLAAVVMISLVILMLIGFVVSTVLNLRKTGAINRRFKGRLAMFQRAGTRALLYVVFIVTIIIVGTGSIQSLTCVDNVLLYEQLQVFKSGPMTATDRVQQTIASSWVFFRGYEPDKVLEQSGMYTFLDDNAVFHDKAATMALVSSGKMVSGSGARITELEALNMMRGGFITPFSVSSTGTYTFDTSKWLNMRHFDPTPTMTHSFRQMNMSAFFLGLATNDRSYSGNAAVGQAMMFLRLSFDSRLKRMLMGTTTQTKGVNSVLFWKLINRCNTLEVYADLIEGVFMLVFMIGIAVIGTCLALKKKKFSYPNISNSSVTQPLTSGDPRWTTNHTDYTDEFDDETYEEP